MSPSEIDGYLGDRENYDLEFKKAKNDFSRKQLHDYCAAISNENGGLLFLGVTDSREVVGTSSFNTTWNTLAHELSKDLGTRVKVFEVMHDRGRVLVFNVSRHYIGRPVKAVGGTGRYVYPIRDGESLVEMDSDTYRGITQEVQIDYSAQTADGVSVKQLDQMALNDYRQRWADHAKNPGHLKKRFTQMLQDIGMIRDGKLTNAALLLFGTESLLQQYVPDAEIIFEWRNDANEIPFGARTTWRAGFLNIVDDIWQTVAARNTVFRYQEGFVQREVDAYDERSIREAVTNAFVHRDYTVSGSSILIKASPDKFYIENPGNFMAGVTIENIIEKSVYRNRLLAESLEKINIMERSSQGVDTIFMRAIENGKGKPHYKVTTDPSIQLTIPAKLVDKNFVIFFEEAVNKRGTSLSPREIVELEMIRAGEKATNLQFRDKFLELGLIEKHGRGRGSHYILAHKYYVRTGETGRHTRLTGLTREVKMNLILKHIRKNGMIRNEDVQTAMPEMDVKAASRLLTSMRKKGLIDHTGSRKDGYWYEVIKENKQE